MEKSSFVLVLRGDTKVMGRQLVERKIWDGGKTRRMRAVQHRELQSPAACLI